MAPERKDTSFLSLLLEKEAHVRHIGDVTRKNMTGPLKEVRRQISQLQNPFTGEGVTKSFEEEPDVSLTGEARNTTTSQPLSSQNTQTR